MKHEWRKKEKQYYLPKNVPELITVPEFIFFTIEGAGNPNSPKFAEYIGLLYSLSYGVKMSPKKGMEPPGYFEYTVYPLEGIWDLSEEGKQNFQGKINKDHLVFKLMIRQPNFVDKSFASKIVEQVKTKKPHPLLDQVKLEKITDGPCIQMLHLGSYDDEPQSFKLMEEFAVNSGYVRESKKHREIYLTDARKVAPEKLKTVLRFQVSN